MVDREPRQQRYHPEFPQTTLPKYVEGFEGIYGILRTGERTMLDLNVVVQSLPPNGRAVLQRAIWEIVDMVSVEGVIPEIIEIDRNGNPV